MGFRNIERIQSPYSNFQRGIILSKTSEKKTDLLLSTLSDGALYLYQVSLKYLKGFLESDY